MLETTVIETYEGVKYEILMRGKRGTTFYCLLKALGWDDYVIVYGLGTDSRDDTKYCWSNGYYFNENLASAVKSLLESCDSVIYQ